MISSMNGNGKFVIALLMSQVIQGNGISFAFALMDEWTGNYSLIRLSSKDETGKTG